MSTGSGEPGRPSLASPSDHDRLALCSLRRLEEHGVLERRLYQERPDRYEYVLTDKGLDLWPGLNHLLQWGDRYYPAPGGPPVTVTHDACGGQPDRHQTRDRCGAALGPQNTTGFSRVRRDS
ncbi:helix-turn-helix domain-containing protein [Streptomyces sp. NPDC046931]|uniref:winged helix-turn-helix transcriptional regulator n=1 Tax=Streptomyces sp. NPDC046931 TaxID=3154806 RepID=UPI0033D3B048